MGFCSVSDGFPNSSWVVTPVGSGEKPFRLPSLDSFPNWVVTPVHVLVHSSHGFLLGFGRLPKLVLGRDPSPERRKTLPMTPTRQLPKVGRDPPVQAPILRFARVSARFRNLD